MSRGGSNQAGAYAITILVLIAMAIIAARTLFPFFFWGTLLSAALAVVLVIVGHFTWNDYSEWVEILAKICVVGAVGCIATYLIGYTLGNSLIGQTALATKASVDTVNEVLDNATDAQIETGRDMSLGIAQATNASPENQRMINATYDIVHVANDLG